MLHEIFAMSIRITTVVTTPSRTRTERDGLDWLMMAERRGVKALSSTLGTQGGGSEARAFPEALVGMPGNAKKR